MSEMCEAHADKSEMCGAHADMSEMCEAHADMSEMCEAHADMSEMCEALPPVCGTRPRSRSCSQAPTSYCQERRSDRRARLLMR